jgi:hypothetical protein
MTVQEMIENLCEQNVLVTFFQPKPDEFRCVLYLREGRGDKVAAESDTIAGALELVLSKCA